MSRRGFSPRRTPTFKSSDALLARMKEVRMVNGEVVDAESFCEFCGHSLTDDWHHCPNCGAEI